MEAEVILFVTAMAVVGAAVGTFSGIVPGIHVNTLATLMLTFYPSIETAISPFVPDGLVPVCVASCIMSAAVVHSFVDYVPSVFIGAPDPDDVVSMLPGHRLLNEGRGMAAIRSAAIGSAVGACVSVAIAIPLQYVLASGLGDYLDSVTAIVLILAMVIMVLQERSVGACIWSIAILAVSGLLGLACMDLDIPSEGLFGEGTMLFPMLTGLFGIPAMLQSIGQTKIVKQRDDEIYPVGPMPGLKGIATGCLTGWFPGITATTGAVISGFFTPEKKAEGFISMVASIGTASSALMLVTMSVSGSGRSGTMLVIGEILGDDIVGTVTPSFLALLLSTSVAAFLGYHITISCGKAASSIISKINISMLNRMCLVLVVALVLIFTGPMGLAVLAASAVIGFMPIYAETSRVSLTGCLIIPTLLTHLGIRAAMLALL